MSEQIWAICPLCDERLDEMVWSFGTAKCPKGHYEYSGCGSYASEAKIILDGKEEDFYFDDMFGDGEKFDQRVKEIREQMKVNWTGEGF